MFAIGLVYCNYVRVFSILCIDKNMYMSDCSNLAEHSIICVITHKHILTLKVLVATIDAQWEGMGDIGSARYEPALLPP